MDSKPNNTTTRLSTVVRGLITIDNVTTAYGPPSTVNAADRLILLQIWMRNSIAAPLAVDCRPWTVDYLFRPYEVGTNAHDEQKLCCGIGAHDQNSCFWKVIEKPGDCKYSI